MKNSCVRAALKCLCVSGLFLFLLPLLLTDVAFAQTNASNIVLYASDVGVRSGNWLMEPDGSAAGGYRLRFPNAGGAKLNSPLATPVHFFEMTFTVQAGIPYRLWMRGKADSNSTNNDSVWVQFSGSVDATGTPVFRIGSDSATMFNLEDCTGCRLSSWGWNDNLFGGMGPLIYFATSGPQTIRVQLREDGLAVDQIVLSPNTYLNSSPGTGKDDSEIIPKETPGSGANTVILWTSNAPSSAIHGNWRRVSDTSAAGQGSLYYPDAGMAKLETALANPIHYFEMNFTAQAGIPYRLWTRGKADGNSTNNDSAWVQFSGSLDSSGAAAFRIGTNSATIFNLEDCTRCGLSGWGWNDNAFGGMGPLIYFANTGPQTIRVQLREDGLAIDQIVLCPQGYLTSSPGAFKNDSTILAVVEPSSTPPPNQTPQVSIGPSVISGITPLPVAFTSSASDPDGYISSYCWEFGDGQTSSEASPLHLYQTSGTYNARLTVTDNAGATASASVNIGASSPPSSGTRFKVLHWNVAYGRGTDNVIDLNRQATWMANMNVDLISLNEVPPSDAQLYANLLMQKMGITWYHHWVPIRPGDSVGQQILSRYPLISNSSIYLSYGRSVAQVTVSIGGKTVNFFSTHLSYEYASWRITQIAEMTNWMAGFAEPRIVAGDFNLCPNWTEYINMTAVYYDSWTEAEHAHTVAAYPDNPEGRTRKARLDYVNFSRSAWNLTLLEVRMPDQRDLSNHNVVITVGNSNDWGVRPSDHNFLVSTFEVW